MHYRAKISRGKSSEKTRSGGGRIQWRYLSSKNLPALPPMSVGAHTWGETISLDKSEQNTI
jgi:hypothetical protein